MKEHSPGVKVIILSAEGQKEMRDEAAKYGADGFVTKPYQKSEILNAIKSCTEDCI